MNDKSYWGLGIGDWGLQSPIPNPQSPGIKKNLINNGLMIKILIKY